MKSFNKITLRLVKIGIIAILALYVGLFLYFKFSWSKHYSKQQVSSIISSIQNTSTLPDSFYILYDKIYSDRHEKITHRYWKSFWTEFITMNQPIQDNWQFVTANMFPYKGFKYKIAPMTLAFRISIDVPPEKCFDYVMMERFKSYCKEFKMNDSITYLSDTENIIRFIVANGRPWYYRRHPTQYKNEIDSLNLYISKS